MEIYFSQVLEAESPRQRCQRDRIQISSLLVGGSLLAVSSHGLSAVRGLLVSLPLIRILLD